MSENKQKLILLGHANKSHGLNGAFFLVLINDQNSQLSAGKKVSIRRNNLDQILTIKKISFGGKTICQFEEISDLNELQSILPFEVWMDRADFAPLNEGEIYLSDLLDYQVVHAEDLSRGQTVGMVVGLSSNGVQDLLQIKWGEEILNSHLWINFFQILIVPNQFSIFYHLSFWSSGEKYLDHDFISRLL